MNAKPRRSRMSAFATLAIGLAVATCFPKDDPTGLPGAPVRSLDAGRAYGEERRAVELASMIPGLAGFYHDTSGNVIVAVTDAAVAPPAREFLRTKFSRELFRGRVRIPEQM